MAVVVGCRWLERRNELAFAIRSLAGAASRSGPVTVLVPGDPRKPEVDGLFDLRGIGIPGALQWPDGVPTDTTIIVDELTTEIASLLVSAQPSSALFLSARDDPISGSGRPCRSSVATTQSACTSR